MMTFYDQLISPRMQSTQLIQDGGYKSNQGRSHFPHIFEAHMDIFIFSLKVKILVFITWSYWSPSLHTQIILTTKHIFES